MRGKANRLSSPIFLKRITPAGAGKSNKDLASDVISKDHPRGCGEKFPTKMMRWKLSGSPPRVRGKAHISSGKRAYIRITPAGAGKRFFQRGQKNFP